MKFLFDRKTHQNPAHHIIQHKILFRTTGVAIVAVDTPARHRNIQIYSLEIFFPTHLGNLGEFFQDCYSYELDARGNIMGYKSGLDCC